MVPTQKPVVFNLAWIPKPMPGTLSVDVTPEQVNVEMQSPRLQGVFLGDTDVPFGAYADEDGHLYWDKAFTAPVRGTTLPFTATADGYYPERGSITLSAGQQTVGIELEKARPLRMGTMPFTGQKGEYVAGLVTGYLTNNGWFDVVERPQVGKLLTERELNEDAVFDPAAVTDFAAQGLDFFVLGEVNADRGYTLSARLVEARRGVAVLSLLERGTTPEEAAERLSTELIYKAADYFRQLDQVPATALTSSQ